MTRLTRPRALRAATIVALVLLGMPWVSAGPALFPPHPVGIPASALTMPAPPVGARQLTGAAIPLAGGEQSAGPSTTKVGTVTETLILSNETTAAGNALPWNGQFPSGLAVDAANGRVFAVSAQVNGTANGSATTPDGVWVMNGTTGRTLGLVLVGNDTIGASPMAAYDPLDGAVMVTNPGSSTVAIINATSDRLSTTVPVGLAPEGICYDPSAQVVLVANSGSSTLTELNASTGRFVANVTVLHPPTGLAFDPSIGIVAVVESSSSELEALNASTLQFRWNLTVGSDPVGIAVDPASGALLVTEAGANNVSIVDGAPGRINATVNVGSAPQGVADLPGTGLAYVANFGSDDLSIVNVSAGKVSGTINVGADPWDLAYDPVSSLLYVTEYGAQGVAAVNLSTASVVSTTAIGTSPRGLAVDPNGTDLFVTNAGVDSLGSIALSNSSFAGTVGFGAEAYAAAYDNATGTLFVSFPGEDLVVAVNGSRSMAVGEIDVGATPEGLAYDPQTDRVYVANAGSDNVSIINASSFQLTGSWNVGWAPSAVAVDLANGDLYVTDGNANSVTVLNVSSGRLLGTIPVGSGPAAIAYDPGGGSLFIANEASNSVSVIDAATGLVVNTTSVGTAPRGLAYDAANGLLYVANGGSRNVSVLDADAAIVGTIAVGDGPFGVVYDPASACLFVSNLFSGTISLVNPGCDSNSSLRVYAYATPNPVLVGQVSHLSAVAGGGTTPYTVRWSHLPGGCAVSASPSQVVCQPTVAGNDSIRVRVTDASGAVVTAGLTLVVAGGTSVDFRAHGLPNGTFWNVSLGGSTNRSATSTIGFRVAPGSYAFLVGVSAQFVADPPRGTVVVAGNTTVNITFRPTYSLLFHETGIKNGTSWTVSLNGTAGGSSGANISFLEPNGTYGFAVGRLHGYASSPSSGNVTINGTGSSVNVTFTNDSANWTGFRVLMFVVNPTPVTLGGTVDVNVEVSGGSAPYTFSYSGFPAGCTPPPRATWSCSPSQVGSSHLEVEVADAAGHTASANATLTVRSGAGASVLAAESSVWVGVGLVVVLAVLVVLALRARQSSMKPAGGSGSPAERFRAVSRSLGTSEGRSTPGSVTKRGSLPTPGEPVDPLGHLV